MLLARLYFPYERIDPRFTEVELLRLRERFLQRHQQNRKSCSCQMCCNPRHSCYFRGRLRLTLQEQRALLSWREQFAELGWEAFCPSGGTR
jgi:hypothetical protein